MKIQPTDALIIIDIQNDFCPGGALAVPEGDVIIPSVNILAAQFRDAGALVALSQDWHTADQISFASRHGVDPFTKKTVAYGEQDMWPDHCVQGTPGAEFHPGLDTTTAQVIIRKGTNPEVDSYSAFYENDQITKTGLTGYLRQMGVTRCFFVGLAYDFCVGFSALDSRRDGFEAVIVKDLTRAISPETADAMKSKLDNVGVLTVVADDI